MSSPSSVADPEGGMMPLRVARKSRIASDVFLFDQIGRAHV